MQRQPQIFSISPAFTFMITELLVNCKEKTKREKKIMTLLEALWLTISGRYHPPKKRQEENETKDPDDY